MRGKACLISETGSWSQQQPLERLVEALKYTRLDVLQPDQTIWFSPHLLQS